ncbi:MAG: UDP-N-acetylmuramoyl-L-alanine--D-glutamate ligase [Lachnospiraceae bacterium]|nr:UDP-N-acetylmuramoyl-L-alanine--D-glutamate ligase [Lachnospiraceae bacterium]
MIDFNGKKILIWGYGREGKSSENFLKTHFCPALIDIFEGKPEELKDEGYDYVFKSPGIPYLEKNPKLISQTDIFLDCFGDRTIGITGTKGKSTTSTLLYKALSSSSKQKVILVGNIGIPCLDLFDEIDNNTLVVFEMSCHQLMHAKKSPHIAIFLNLFEDHLDCYKTEKTYFEAKRNITAFQKAGDIFICGENVPGIKTKATTYCMISNKVKPSMEYAESFGEKCEKTLIYADELSDKLGRICLKGEHNRLNAAFVLFICEKSGADMEKAKKEIKNFRGLPHRMEYFKTVNGVRFYDDSISTIPEATISAVKSIYGTKTVIVGGMDRGIDYSVLESFIRKRKKLNFILSYESGSRIMSELTKQGNEKLENVYLVKDLKEASELAFKITPKGKAVVLSPAAASYGYFKNFEERGEYFKALICNDDLAH